MKSRETAIKLKRFEAEETARKVADLEHMIRELEAVATDLDRQIQAEEERTGIKDQGHYAYSTFAKSAAQRRDNLRASVAGLRLKLAAAERERDEVAEQLVRVDAADGLREGARGRRRHERGPSALVR
jgi:hypothetical protein